jgi:putative transposase
MERPWMDPRPFLVEEFMGHTYSDNLVHVVFSTAERLKYGAEKMHRVREYMGGIARENGFSAVAVGGAEDHAHVLLQLPTTITTAKAAQLIKGGSSKWFNKEYPGSGFSWQQGFSVFSVSRSQLERVVAYIAGQAEHHRKRSFEEEFKALLKKHGIEFDERYVLG